VAGRQHDTEVRVAGFGEEGDPGSGQYTEPNDIHPGTGQTGDNGGLQELTRGARIPTDDREGPVSVELPSLGEYVSGRDGKAQREFRGKGLVGLAAYTVGSEESPH
jgi:hypothetical protein